jgi:hypothetical protein
MLSQIMVPPKKDMRVFLHVRPDDGAIMVVA